MTGPVAASPVTVTTASQFTVSQVRISLLTQGVPLKITSSISVFTHKRLFGGHSVTV